MKHYDLHNHTESSHDSEINPRVLVDSAIKSGLDGIAITNHGTVSDIEEARDYADGRLEVIPSAEVTSEDYGDVLCLYIDRVPDHDGSAKSIITETHNNDGVAILAHPYAYRTVDFRGAPNTIIDIADAIETVNARNIFERLNRKAEDLAEKHSKPCVGGSDVHFPFESGRARTLIPDDLNVREAISENKTVAKGSGGNISSHIARLASDIGLKI